MGITVTTSDQQITASVGETKIDVSVSGGIGPAGPTGAAGASSWADITGKPSTFTPSAHKSTHATGGSDALTASDIGAALAADFDQGLKTTDNVSFNSVAGTSLSAYAGTVILDNRGIYFGGDDSVQTTAWTGSVDWANVTSKPTLFDGAYTSLTSVPSSFTPSAHKTSHATGGSDALSPSDIGAASAGHQHGAADITSGTLNAARLPSTTVTAASYGSASSVATFTVDATGRLTAAGSTAIAIAYTAVSGLGTLATQSGTFSGTSSGINTGDQTITLTGDVTGSGTGTFAATLANSGVSSGSYGSASAVPVLTIDAKGRVTAASTAAVNGESFHPFLFAGM